MRGRSASNLGAFTLREWLYAFDLRVFHLNPRPNDVTSWEWGSIWGNGS